MYDVRFTPNAESDLARLDKPTAHRVLRKLHWVAENFEVLAPEPLAGNWQGVFKLRVGDYRILYTFDKPKTTIIVHFVKHRSDVYKIR